MDSHTQGQMSGFFRNSKHGSVASEEMWVCSGFRALSRSFDRMSEAHVHDYLYICF